MKIYTKTGDKGKTSLFGGGRVSKNNIRIESYGTIDELNAQIGYLSDLIADKNIKNDLFKIQNQLFIIGSILATNPDKITLKSGKDRLDITKIKKEDVFYLEHKIDKYNSTLPKMTHFILPVGHISVSSCHIARTICRRAERRIVALQEVDFVEDIVLEYINRLSDYLFVLARKLTVLNKVKEIFWIPKKE